MTRFSPILLIVLVGCDVTGPATKSDDKADIQAVYDRIARGVEARDISAVTAYSLPTATLRLANGNEISLADWKEQARTSWANIRSTKSKITVESVQTIGDTAEATYAETHETVTVDPAGGPDQETVYTGRWKATLKRTADGWRISRSVEESRKVTPGGMTPPPAEGEPKP